jgi:hypothetical protein
MRSLVSAIALGALLLGSSSAQASLIPQQHYWSSNGAGCVPGDPAIQFDRYFITAGAVNYRTNGNGLVTLYCPVNPSGILNFDQLAKQFITLPFCPDNAYSFRLTYTDSDGAGTLVSVASQLIRLSKSNGQFGGAVPGTVFSSNSSSAVTSTNHRGDFDHGFDFQNAYYYFRVDMNRAAGTTQVATFYGVALECR